MKKLLTIVLSICMLASMLFGLIGCGHTHTWDSGTVITEATCSIEGVQSFTCSGCEQTKTEVIPKTEHTWDSGKTTTAATCTKDGLKTTTCGNCGATQVESISKTGHSYVAGETIEAGCLTHGHITYACSCGVSYDEIIPAKGKHNTLNATWQDVTSAGSSACSFVYTPTTQCKDCGASIRGQSHESEIHTFKAEITTQATCSQTGVLTYKCNNCNESYTEDIAIAPNVHTWVEFSDSEFTHKCSGCDAKKIEKDFSNTTVATLSKSEMSEEVSIKTEKATLQPDAALVEALGENVTLSADTVTASDLTNVKEEVLEKIGSNPVYEFSLTDGTNDVQFNGGKMVISVPYELLEGEDPNSIYVWYINGQNEPEEIPAIYDSITKTATFTVEHFSYYTVIRLTAEERCAKSGHNYVETEFIATCSQDGYTLKVCKRCDYIERVQGEDDGALGHNYVEVVTPATCTEQGYTTNTCNRENCSASFISNYTDIIAHTFVAETPVEATCTLEGYQKQTCSACGYSYKSNTYAKIAHNFVSGVCSVCQFVDGTYVEPNVYFNLIESINPLDGMTITTPNNLVIKVTMPGENGQTMTQTISMAESFTYKFDENGYIVGKGVINMTMDMDGEKQDQSMTIAFKDGKLYAFDKSYNAYTIMNQDDMFANMFGQGVSMQNISAMISGMIPQDIINLIGAIKDKGSNPINKILGSVIEAIFVKEETASGLTFTFNEENLTEVYDFLTTKYANEIIDAIFGENAYASIVEFATNLPQTKVKDLHSSMADITERCGISFNDLVDIIQAYVDSNMGTAESGESLFSIREFLESNKEMTIAELMILFMEEPMTIEEIETMWADNVTQFDQMLKAMKLTDVIGMVLKVQIDEQTLTMVGSMLQYVEELLSQGLVVNFNTDKEGNFISSFVQFNQLAVTMPDMSGMMGGGSVAPLSQDVVGGTVQGGSSQQAATMSILINGSIKVEKEGSLALDVTQMINQAESRKNSFKVPTEAIDLEYGYKLVPIGNNKILYVQGYNETKYQGQSGEATIYNGQNCNLAYVKVYNSTYLFSLDSVSIEDSCMDWIRYSFTNAQYMYGAIYKVYYLENGVIIATELDIEKTLEIEDSHQSGMSIFYNPKTEKYTTYEPHKYVLTEESRPEGCDKWWTVVKTCVNCHDQQIERWNTGHEKEEIIIKLKDATLGCAGGAIQEYRCVACNKVIHQEEYTGEYLINSDGTHVALWYRDYIETDCGGIYVDGSQCACGQYGYVNHVGGQCQFDYIESESTSCEFGDDDVCVHGYNNHYYETYRCAVTDCAYTYYTEYINSTEEENCLTTHNTIRKYMLPDGDDTIVYIDKYANSYYFHGEIDSNVSVNGDVKTVTQNCLDCRNMFSIYKYITLACGCEKTIYYFDAIEKQGWEREFLSTCSYKEYQLDENGQKILNTETFYSDAHNYYSDNRELLSEGSCSQPSVYRETCHCCFNERIHTEGPYGHYYNEYGVCEYCETINYNQADGAVILEDMSTDSEIIIGYYNRFGGKIDTYIEAYAGDFVDLVEAGLEISQMSNEYEPNSCGKIIISKAQLAEILSKIEITSGEISIYYCMSLPGGEFDSDYVLTFTFEEIFGEQA